MVNKSNQDVFILVALIVGAVFYQYRGVIEDRLHNPFFLVFLVCLGGLVLTAYFTVGHYVEKTMNRMNMLRLGIKKDDKEERMTHPFLPFDLQTKLDEFYSKKENYQETFLGLDATVSNNAVISIPDIQRSQHL